MDNGSAGNVDYLEIIQLSLQGVPQYFGNFVFANQPYPVHVEYEKYEAAASA